MNPQPNPYSLRSRGKQHGVEEHAAPFRQCLTCWPGATLCGRCGHISVDGSHGVMRVGAEGTRLVEYYPCTVGANPAFDSGIPCGCTLGKPLPVRVIEDDDMLPASSGLSRPRPFGYREPSAAAHRRSLRGRR